MIEQLWAANGSSFSPVSIDPSNLPGKLPAGVYRINFDPRQGWSLIRLEDSFSVPAKVYGLQRDFIERVKTSFGAYDKNLGVMLSGTRGTGKTVTCKMLCNELGLPVVLVDKALDGLPQFLGELAQTVVFFFDEFEKVFEKDHGESLLSVMDGASTNPHKKLFLLTTNHQRVDANFIDRPGRIRYKKAFGNLDKIQVTEIATDRLKDKAQVSAIVEYVSSLDTISIDVVLALCDEVNLFGDGPEDFGKIFNATLRSDSFDIKIRQADGTWKTEEYSVGLTHKLFDPRHVGQRFGCTGNFGGTIKKVLSTSTAEIQSDDGERVTLKVVKVRAYNKEFVDGPGAVGTDLDA